VAVVVCFVWASPTETRGDSEASGSFVVVAHPKVPVASASRELLTDLFLKRKTRWDDGESVLPVDLKPESRVRERFSERVLKRSVAAVRSYWQQRIFSGRSLPPPELESGEAVVRYVSKHPGGLGYVAADTELAGVKVLSIR
jgi:ABC-type phosphate transport system substrate-binding protein